ncbi:beta-aspartyl-peptidase [Trifolium repens]|jgi:hypothetical protein|nr:beta-aspartyl-peptidase [Trifolium repens]
MIDNFWINQSICIVNTFNPIAVRGDAGVDPNLPPQLQEKAEQLLTYRLNLGISALHSNASAVDVIELAIPSFIIM